MKVSHKATRWNHSWAAVGRRARLASGESPGKADFGPLGFLNLLETRLGLLRAECTQAQRVTQYPNVSSGVTHRIVSTMPRSESIR